MKAIVEINQKIGQPNYGSFGAGCRFEMEIDQASLTSDPQSVLNQCRLLGDLARAAVERELDLQRKAGKPTAPAREPGDDDEPDDLHPGDPAYERSRPARQDPQLPPRGRNNYEPDRRSEGERRQSLEDRQRGYSEYIEESRPRDDRQDRSGGGGSDRRNGRDEGPPRTARQFLGWLNKQDGDVIQRCKRTAKAWGLPSMMKEWTEGEAEDMYRELTAKRESASHRNGAANGNGRY